MDTSDFDYYLPKELIAQTPAEPRDSSGLLVLDKNSGDIKFKKFKDILDYVSPGDCVVFNDSKVMPARMYSINKKNNRKVEFLLLKNILELSCDDFKTWECLVSPGKHAKVNDKFWFQNSGMEAEIIDARDGVRVIKFTNIINFWAELDKIGTTPLPKYIQNQQKDASRYQTVYAKYIGSAAAPTAGLHFTENLLLDFQKKHVNLAFITLHVGLGTFQPVKTQNINEHVMHSEVYNMPKKTVDIIQETVRNNKKIFAVGTTVCRTLESIALKFNGELRPDAGETNIFIKPGFKFNIVHSLITNFHLPKSTLIMLVSAFAGIDNIKNAYKQAIENNMNFFSFGDAMLIL
ncbi:MAG: tRNA preQ1(34) S-adenosylmethionine ribosyltransferase-isomerase QueA [Candidatus Improbicoccus devescovinae]|nr:MAG: tRNA preQ1(34) S-adenosylmethionine ribosyltransferase-isomerase QueA [Candidatus Improbicoccus devescovinae]